MGGVTPRATKVFFDGGCRPNPGVVEVAVVIGGRVQVRRDLGYGGSMDAEWAALTLALELAVAAGLGALVLLGDARAVIDQANAVTQARGANAGRLAAFRTLAASAPAFRVRYVKRSQNLAGIALARLRA